MPVVVLLGNGFPAVTFSEAIAPGANAALLLVQFVFLSICLSH